ncbi:uncharacterized protein LOC143767243 isoform X1 [Ranitomeya variabilis]|uniref:uncharacterized protein LOC143767243 isoform X1 n=1 Tax=Ranitomeya variabilis TaxID=490064 RepID=UPI00405674FC
MWCAALQVEVPTISDPLSGDLLYKRILLSDPTRMERDRDKMAERILHLTLEILFRLTGEDYTLVKKTSSERCQAPVSEGWGRPLSPITGPPPHPLIHEDINDQRILELTYKMIELLTGEVPIRCQDVTVYFSMEEWEYLEGHKDQYKDIMMEVPRPLTSPVLSSKRTTPERCPRPLLPQDCKQEDSDVPQDHQVPTILDPLSGDLLYKRILLSDPTRMDRDRDKMAERILHLTLEILFWLTGQDYTVVKKTSTERFQASLSEGWGRPLSPITGPSPHPLIHEDINDQKILELTYKMIELLTGEVPIRCQHVAVYFSMEEWDYLEEHKDCYKDIKMEVPQPLTSPVLSSERTTPERCPRPLLPQDCKQEDPYVPQVYQGKYLPHINTTEPYMRGDERFKEEIPTDNRTDDGTRSSEGQLIFSAGDQVDLVKRRWRSARDPFRLECNPLPSKAGASKKRQHVFYRNLAFLRPILEPNPTDDNLEDPTSATQPDEQVADAAEHSTDAGPGSTQTTAPTTSQTAAPAPQAASTSNLPQYLSHTLRDRRTRRQEQPRMLPKLIDSPVVSILNSMTTEHSADQFCRSLAPCLAKVPDEWQKRVRSAILTLIAASQGDQDPYPVLGPIEQWRAAQHQIQMPSATNITHAQNVGTLSSEANPGAETQQSQQMLAPLPMLPPPASRHRYPQMFAPVWFPPAHC